jgi:hypothetical protein
VLCARINCSRYGYMYAIPNLRRVGCISVLPRKKIPVHRWTGRRYPCSCFWIQHRTRICCNIRCEQDSAYQGSSLAQFKHGGRSVEPIGWYSPLRTQLLYCTVLLQAGGQESSSPIPLAGCHRFIQSNRRHFNPAFASICIICHFS